MTNDNKCYAIGRTDYGRLGIANAPADPVTKLTVIGALAKLKVTQVECGECCSFAITDDGKVYGWGFGSNQQVNIEFNEIESVSFFNHVSIHNILFVVVIARSWL